MIFSIKKPLLGELLGLAGDNTEIGNESVIASINMKLDQMFRESIVHRKNVALLPETELDKIAGLNAAWRERSKRMEGEQVNFKPREVGIPEVVLNEINGLPELLCQHCDAMDAMVLAQSPQLYFKQHKSGLVNINVWLKFIVLPQL